MPRHRRLPDALPRARDRERRQRERRQRRRLETEVCARVGQPLCEDSPREPEALDKTRGRGHDVSGAALASDAFFPFADGPQLALDAGVRSIIQPGGSKRDDEVTDAVRAAGALMVLTHRRHFRH